jgi:Ca2+-binding RTX toxin-like protein
VDPGDGVTRAVGLLLAAGAVALALPAGAGATPPDTVDLLRAPAATVLGARANDALGSAMADAGDVNGDGIGDYLLASPAAGPRGVRTAGVVDVVFGHRGPLRVDLAHPTGPWGFRIEGAALNDRLGRSVAALGDVNGDGLGDVAVGAPLSDFPDRRNSGAVVVVFGKRDGGTVRSDRLGAHGYRIRGAGRRWLTGVSVAGAGDVNGDGRPDVLLGATGAGSLDPQPLPDETVAPVADADRQGTGMAFVVFGKPGPGDVDLAALGGQGYEIEGAGRGDMTGAVVAGAGDVNRDGRADQLVAAPYASPDGRTQAGRVWVLYGQASTDRISLDRVTPAQGWSIAGARPLDRLAGQTGWGSGAATVGDVDGDGFPDFAVSSWAADPYGRRDAGAAWVASGAPGAGVDLAQPGAALMTVYGKRARDYAGRGLAPAGDVDGDGLADLAVGAPGDLNEHDRPGVAYVVLAAGGRGIVDLHAGGPRVVRLVGGTEDRAGGMLAAGPIGTLLVGRIGVRRGRTAYNAGAVTVVRPGAARGAIHRRGTSRNETFVGGSGADRLLGGNGDDRLTGFGGDDLLDGGQGRDVLDGGDGDDTLRAGDGRDVVRGGAGNDTIDVADHLRDVVDCGPGVDTVRARRGDVLRHCERVIWLKR